MVISLACRACEAGGKIDFLAVGMTGRPAIQLSDPYENV